MNYIKDHSRLVASRDHAEGTLRVRVDYMANGDTLTFYIDGDKSFIVSKKILHRTNSGITYTIVVENVGMTLIETPIVLYSENNGVFTMQKIFKREIVGQEAVVQTLKVGQQTRLMFLVRQIEKKEEAFDLIKDLTDNTVYGRKILSIFERLSEELKNDKELFLEGLQHNPYVMNYASDELKRDIELVTIQTDKIIQFEKSK